MLELSATTLINDTALKGYWKGEDLTDSSTNGKTLTKTGTVNHSAALFGNGFSANFTDATNHLTNTSVYTPGTGDITVATVFLKNGGPAADFTPTILSIGDSGGAIRCTLQAVKTTGYLESLFYNAGGNTISSTSNVCNNANHWIVMTRVGTTVTIYVDGSSVGSGTSSKNITSGNILFGYAGASSGYDYIGDAVFDETFVMSRGLSAAEVTAHWNGTDGISLPSRRILLNQAVNRASTY